MATLPVQKPQATLTPPKQTATFILGGILRTYHLLDLLVKTSCSYNNGLTINLSRHQILGSNTTLRKKSRQNHNNESINTRFDRQPLKDTNN